MNFFQMEVFLKVVDSGSFTRAGEQIGLTQSGVSHNITALETELNVSLLKRGRNGISLTTAGEYIIPHMRAIMQNMDNIEQKVAAMNGLEIGKLSIGSFPSFSSNYIPILFSIFKERFPNIELHLFEGSYNDIVKWVEDGVVDIGFAALPVKNVDFTHLLEDPLYAVVYNGHFFENNTRLSIENFEDEPFIMLRSGCETLIEDRFREANCKLTITYDVKDNQTVLSMVENKLGISIMPSLAIPKNHKRIRSISISTSLSRDIGLITKQKKELTPIAQEFSRVVQNYFQNN